ncbi:MAG: hypothetical protein JXA03_07125 [Bacteroidales bacterium]|nr:hypothetical protein [Bacteroidales bacterium]
MKKICTMIIVLSALLSANLNAQEPESLFSEGTTFIYEVDFNGRQYLFISTILNISEEELKIKWLISNNGSQGTLTMGAEALMDATALHNYFVNGENYTLSDKTSGWVSGKVAGLVRNEGKVTLDLGNQEIVDFILDYQGLEPAFENAAFFYPVGVDLKYGDVGSLGAYTIKNDEKGYEIKIHHSEQYPLILYMNLGWTIRLLAII